MPLEWKTTKIKRPSGTVEITHWAKHDPQKLLKALEAKPQRVMGLAMPLVSVHRFGRHRLAVRHEYLWSEFDMLRDLAEKRAAVVEMPVAYIYHPVKGYLAVTLWKKAKVHRSLGGFLRDSKVSREDKFAACLSAVRKMAKLHAAGYVHDHLDADNFVLDNSGGVHMVDYTMLKRNLGNASASEAETLISELGTCPRPFNRVVQGDWMDKMFQQYHKWLFLHKQKLEEAGLIKSEKN